MSKIIKLKANNLFNLNYNSNIFIYPKTFFDKVYISNSIRNNTINAFAVICRNFVGILERKNR